MTESILILDPAARASRAVAATKQMSGGVAGRTIGFIDNTKPNFDVLVDDMAELLVREYGARAIVKHRKRAPSMGAGELVMQDVQEKCDLVITGSGD